MKMYAGYRGFLWAVEYQSPADKARSAPRYEQAAKRIANIIDYFTIVFKRIQLFYIFDIESPTLLC